MKKVLVIGKNSYIAAAFCNYADKKFDITAVSASNGEWEACDFNQYDTVINFAGIAHRKETEHNAKLYFEVNRDLALKIAEKSKASDIYYILLSSMSVYGLVTGQITEETIPHPTTNYGKSKLEAEILISGLSDDSFKPAIIRPPMVYGLNCKGNFQTLLRFTKKLPLFPDFENRRSMIFIDNLCEFICLTVENKASGLLYPQDRDYVCTSDMVRETTRVCGKKIFFTRLFNGLISLLCPRVPLVSKIFSDLTYAKSLSNTFDCAYQIYDVRTAISRSVEKN